MSVVSNASPLINLARIGELNLLSQLYGELIVPEAVWREVVLEDAGQPGAKEVETASWIQVRSATNRELVQALRQELDAGEAEAIALALEVGAEFLLMDERLGRNSSKYGFSTVHFHGAAQVGRRSRRQKATHVSTHA